MQRTIARYAHCLHYEADDDATKPGAPNTSESGTLGSMADAFEVTLRVAARRAKTPFADSVASAAHPSWHGAAALNGLPECQPAPSPLWSEDSEPWEGQSERG